MELKNGVELLENLEGMRQHSEGVLSDLAAGSGLFHNLRRKLAQRELADINERLGKLKLALADACDREIAETGAYAVSLADTMALARRFSDLSARAAAVASACRNWREEEAKSLIKEFAGDIDGLRLETRIRLIDCIDDVEDSDTDVVRMSTFLRDCISNDGIRAVGEKLDVLSRNLDIMKQAELDFAWQIRAQMVSGELPDPSPALVEVVGHVTGKQISYDVSHRM